MKKRILSFALALIMLLTTFPVFGYASESDAVDCRFGKFQVGIDYIVSAQISNANVTGVTRVEAAPEEDETNRLHYLVELSQYTQDGDLVLVDMSVSEQTVSGIGSALKKDKVGRVDARNDTNDTHYEIVIDSGKGRMVCYSYYSKTLYTTFIIDFVVGDAGIPYTAPEKAVIGDNLLNAFHFWDADIMKCYYKQIDYSNSAVYIWLEEDVPDDAVIGVEPLLRYCGGFSQVPEGWNAVGGYVQLENGEAEFKFTLKGTQTPLLGTTRLYTVYIKNHMSYAPQRTADPQVMIAAEVGYPVTVKLNDYFVDRDGDILSYDVSVNAEAATRQTNTRYRIIPKEEGETVLTVTAWDALWASEPCQIVIQASKTHVWSEWIVEKEPACTESGSRTHTCRSCGLPEQEELFPTGHVWSDWLVSNKENCRENGISVRVCYVCGETETESIPVGDHDWIVKSTTATCNESGIKELECSVCGEISSEYAEATGLHDWGIWECALEATCVEAGVEERSCSVCRVVEYREIPVTDHHWSGWEMTRLPTCGEDGEQRRICSHCAREEIKAVPSVGNHEWGIWSIIKEPTMEEDGIRERSCRVCDISEQETFPMEQQVYVTISSMGELVVTREIVHMEDRNKNGTLDIDDALILAHELYGDAGDYTSSGGFISQLWGIPTRSIGFLCNNEYAYDTYDPVVHGDDIYAFTYVDYINCTDQYAFFDRKEYWAAAGKQFSLTLNAFVYGTSKSPVSGAVITVDGDDTAYKTDAMGKVTLKFDAPGTYCVSARSTSSKITPPICMVHVSAGEAQTLDPPVLSDVNATATTLTVTPPSASVLDPDALVKYSISENGSAWSPWQISNSFEKLSSGTKYYIRARYCSSDTMRFKDSPASQVLEAYTSAGNSVVYSFGNLTAAPGETILIPVSIQTDPMQVSRWNMEFLYDKSVFTMNGVTPAEGLENWTIKANLFTKTAYGKPVEGKAAQMPGGKLLYLSMTIAASAEEGVYAVSLSDTWNVGMKNTFLDENGKYIHVTGSSVPAVITVTGNPTEPPAEGEGIPKPGFKDVEENVWYSEPVKYMSETGLMKGVGADVFGVDVNTSRAMLVTILYRMEGAPEVHAGVPFADVPANAYYADAVAWAAENGIVNGVSEAIFAPDENVTRQQICAIVYRYQNYLGIDASASAALEGFADSAEVSDYAEAAVRWAVASGLIRGMDGNLVPNGNANHSQVAAILFRYLGE